MRGLMRSAARLTYEQVQAGPDGAPDEPAGPLRESRDRAALWRLRRAAEGAARRAARSISTCRSAGSYLDSEGRIDRIVPRQRLDSHRLIEEFMIAANVAAAEALEEATPALHVPRP